MYFENKNYFPMKETPINVLTMSLNILQNKVDTF